MVEWTGFENRRGLRVPAHSLEPIQEKLSDWMQSAKSGDLKNLKKQFVKQIHEKDKDGFTALHWACHKGHLEMAKFLLLQEQDVNAKVIYGYTPLHLATWSGNLEIVKLLVSKGAYLNAQNNDGDTSLEIAEHNLFHTISTFLKTKGAKAKKEINKTNSLRQRTHR